MKNTFKQFNEEMVQEQNIINNMMTLAEELGCDLSDDSTMGWVEMSAEDYLAELNAEIEAMEAAENA